MPVCEIREAARKLLEEGHGLVPGAHRITLKTPEGETWSEKVRVIAGHEVELKVRLED